LVRGVDEYHNFAPERRPESDLSAAALAHHAEITGEANKILLRDTARTGAM